MRRRRKREIENEFGVLLQTLRWGGEHGELCSYDRAPDLYIITTARKRDTGEWDEELAHFYMSTDPEHDIYEHKVVVDSWNNIGKYIGVKNAFFIFDEQRVVGKGAWVKSFYKITQKTSGFCSAPPRGLLDGLYPGVHRQWVLPKQNGL